MLPPGKHMVKVQNVAFTGGGELQPQLAIYFEDELGESITWYSGVGVTKDGSFSQAGFDYAANQLRSLGWDPATNAYDFEALAPEDVTQSPIHGRAAEIVVVNEPFEGRDRIKVKFINDPDDPRRGGGLGERMAPNAARTFAERIRAGLRAGGKAVPAATLTRRSVAARPAPTTLPKEALPADPINHDDIPF